MTKQIFNYRTIFFTFFLLFFTNLGTKAQWSAAVNLDQEYNSNPFRSPLAQASWISNLNGKLQHEWNRYAFRYFGSFLKFNLIPERNFYWHQVSFWGGSDTLNYGATIEQRINRNDYNIYDYTRSSAYLNYRINLSGIWLTSTNTLSTNHYSQLEQLNNWQIFSKLQFNKGFKTKTSLIGGVGVNYKKYFPTQENYILSGVDTIYSGQNFQGRGQGRGQRNYGTPIYDYIPSESPSLAQLSYWVRMAQSVTPTTGLAIQIQQRKLVNGLDRYISGLTYNYSDESQLFDDPMSYESLTFGSEITKLLPASFTLKMAYYLMTKDYISQGIYLDSETFDEQILRKDTYRTAWFSLAKEIFFSKTSDHGLLLLFNFQWAKNMSNSYWYQYNNTSWSIGLEYSL